MWQMCLLEVSPTRAAVPQLRDDVVMVRLRPSTRVPLRTPPRLLARVLTSLVGLPHRA